MIESIVCSYLRAVGGANTIAVNAFTADENEEKFFHFFFYLIVKDLRRLATAFKVVVKE